MPLIHAPRGLPGAGKTTLAKRIAAATAAVHVELDVIKLAVWPDVPRMYDPYSGPGLAVQQAFEAEVLTHLTAGHNVVLDRTNLNEEGLRRIQRLVPGVRIVIHDLRDTPLDDCLARDAARPPHSQVGADGIRALHHRWL